MLQIQSINVIAKKKPQSKKLNRFKHFVNYILLENTLHLTQYTNRHTRNHNMKGYFFIWIKDTHDVDKAAKSFMNAPNIYIYIPNMYITF